MELGRVELSCVGQAADAGWIHIDLRAYTPECGVPVKQSMTEPGALHSLESEAGPHLGAARAVELLQGRSVLAIVRALIGGALPFTGLLRASGARSATTLQRRLNQMQSCGVVTHHGTLYALSDQGMRLRPLLDALDQFQQQHPVIDPASLLLSLQRRHCMPIMRCLIPGELGFNDLMRAVQTPSATTLSRRLSELESLGLVIKAVQSGMPPRTSYRHSAVGTAFSTVIGHIVLWGEGLPPSLIAAVLGNETRAASQSVRSVESAAEG